MSTHAGEPLQWWWKRPHTCVTRWNLQDTIGLNEGQISVGSFADGGWYVDHGGFGCRGFPDKYEAWAAVGRLKRLHEGSWEQVSGDSERRSPLLLNGARVIYSDCPPDMYRHWGRLQDERLSRYRAAMDAG